MRKLLDRIDHGLGRVLGRTLGALCILAGSAAFGTGVVAMKRLGFLWSLLLPIGAGLVFIWLGVWLWRIKRRLSDYDWSGV